MPFAILLFLIQIAFAVHVVKTGRETFWIFLIIFIPLFGCIIYFITQIMPEMGGNRSVRRAARTLIKAVDPERELRRRKDDLVMADTIENRMKLAEECIDAGFYADAIGLMQDCLKGTHQHDPHLLLLLAKAEFGAALFAQTKHTLDRLIENNPEFKSYEGHLLYARTLEELNLLEQAGAEYEVLLNSFPGEEARVRYGQLLMRTGQQERARRLFAEALARARRAPGYYRKNEKPWLTLAEQGLAG